MKLTSFLLLWSLGGWSPFVANADQRAQVTLTLDEFEDLYSTAKLKDVYRKLQDQKQRNHDEHLSKLEQLKQQHQQEIFPTNFQVLEYAAIGNYNATAATSTTDDNNMAVFDMKMTIRVMGDERLRTLGPCKAKSTGDADSSLVDEYSKMCELLTVPSPTECITSWIAVT
ncbi:expressed unknown protein [Seminavis robusta]|uniref:Uncharacterized protein n=1 Tax=Seminavis robusta TaxID=568900 RepID=A0A9N8EX64_9STRA|nr:expressed unknown protein [Seminavis robusta]|eukprot:Sro2346_g324240.1 n/a (170) ;mRNA; f:14567-15076